MHACSSDHTLHVCRVGALTSVLSCKPLKKKIAHTATYFTVTSGRSGPEWDKEGMGRKGREGWGERCKGEGCRKEAVGWWDVNKGGQDGQGGEAGCVRNRVERWFGRWGAGTSTNELMDSFRAHQTRCKPNGIGTDKSLRMQELTSF